MENTFSSRLEAVALRTLMALPVPVMRRLAGPPVVHDGQVLDVETQWLLRVAELLKEPPVDTLPIPEGRRVVVRQSRMTGGRQHIGAVRDLELPGGDGPVPARLYTPRSRVHGGTAAPLLFFIHGGGMIYGDLDAYDAVCRFLAERADCLVLSVDYRLAPEHPYPAAVHDCWASYQWVAEHAAELGADPDRLAVGGDSAGGYLSALVAVKAAQAGVPLRHQLLVYPVTDMSGGTGESRARFAEGFYLTSGFIGLADRSYLAPEVDRRDPEVSVLFTEKVPEGLAPASVVTAGFDPLRDEGEAYARLLADHGVPVELTRYPGMIHSFFNVIGVGRSSRAAVAEIAAKLKAVLHAAA
jgi:acetyl esterase